MCTFKKTSCNISHFSSLLKAGGLSSVTKGSIDLIVCFAVNLW